MRGAQDVWEMPGAAAFSRLAELVPPDLAAWAPKNAHWDDSPFVVYAGDEDGALHAGDMWVDHHDPTSGVVRAYAAIQGDAFVALPMGIHERVFMEGERFELSGAAAFWIRGRFR